MSPTKWRMLDLYSGAGGAGVGYATVGFDVTGVDLSPQPNYPHTFVQADALEFAVAHGHEFDVIHASPPCQAYCTLTKGTRGHLDTLHPELIGRTRDVLTWIGRPFVIENVVGAPVRKDLVLCGEMFGLGVLRHRVFELGGWDMVQPEHLKHRGRVAGYRHGQWFDGPYFAVYGAGGGKGSVAEWQTAMGIPWTSVRREIAEAIPPAYTQHIGRALLAHLTKGSP